MNYKNLIIINNEKIFVESRTGIGSEFSFTLKCVKENGVNEI